MANCVVNDDIETLFEDLKTNTNFTNLPNTLRPHQTEALKCLVIDKQNVMGYLPTGCGKTMIFILGSIMMSTMCLVISPLRSIMAIQKKACDKMGVSSVVLKPKSEMKFQDIRAVKQGHVKIMFMCPECLQARSDTSYWKQLISSTKFSKKIGLICFDEVHLLHNWGTTFRPAYRLVGELRSMFEKALVLMLTGTLTQPIYDSILKLTHIDESELKLVWSTLDRPNIVLKYKSDANMQIPEELAWLVKEVKDKGRRCSKSLIYVRNITQCGNVWFQLMSLLKNKAHYDGDLSNDKTRLVNQYHSCLSEDDLGSTLADFMDDKGITRVLIASLALSTGVDLNSVKNVIIWGTPNNVLDLWQQIGRGGRDGLPCTAYLYFTRVTLFKQGPCIKAVAELIKKGTCVRKAILQSMQVTGMEYAPCSLTECCTICSSKK